VVVEQEDADHRGVHGHISTSPGARSRPSRRQVGSTGARVGTFGPFSGACPLGRVLLACQSRTRRSRDHHHRPEEHEELAALTDQERKILALIAEGLTNRQIGERMFLAEKTVKNYVSRLLLKLGFAGRTQAALFAAESVRRSEPGPVVAP
jgi:DNA-binding CsgD family transcriptional regulator